MVILHFVSNLRISEITNVRRGPKDNQGERIDLTSSGEIETIELELKKKGQEIRNRSEILTSRGYCCGTS